MANKSMLLGSNEATTLTTKPVAINIKGTNLLFGVGLFDESKVVEIATAENADSKVRFVYDGPGGSGLVFVGNKLVSSKVLDAVPVIEARKVMDPSTGKLVDSSTEKAISQIQIKWFGTLTDPEDNTSKTKVWTSLLDIIDRSSVAEMIKASEYALNEKYEKIQSDSSTLLSIINSSISEIRNYLKNKIVTPATNGAINITNGTSKAGFTTYKVGVNVDSSTVQIVNNKIATATYTIDKLNEGEEGYSTEWAAQYRMLQIDPVTGESKQVGDTIDIMKDFLVKRAHVCIFKYASNDGTLIDYDNSDTQWEGSSVKISKGDAVIAGQLPWAKLPDGSWEQAIVNHDIKYGHTYLHLILNTKPTDETTEGDGNLLTNDVFLDLQEIFTSFTGDGEYVNVDENGVITINKDNIVKYVDTSLGISDYKKNTDSSITIINSSIANIDSSIKTINSSILNIDSSIISIDSSIATLEEKLKDFSGSYVVNASIEEPKADNTQFNKVTLSLIINGKENSVTFDVANASFYEALNTALSTLQSNDEYLAGLLTWDDL